MIFSMVSASEAVFTTHAGADAEVEDHTGDWCPHVDHRQLHFRLTDLALEVDDDLDWSSMARRSLGCLGRRWWNGQ